MIVVQRLSDDLHMPDETDRPPAPRRARARRRAARAQRPGAAADRRRARRRRRASAAAAASTYPVTKSTCTHHFKVLREAGVIQPASGGTARLNTLRREDLDARFPGRARHGPTRGLCRPPIRRPELRRGPSSRPYDAADAPGGADPRVPRGAGRRAGGARLQPGPGTRVLDGRRAGQGGDRRRPAVRPPVGARADPRAGCVGARASRPRRDRRDPRLRHRPDPPRPAPGDARGGRHVRARQRPCRLPARSRGRHRSRHARRRHRRGGREQRHRRRRRRSAGQHPPDQGRRRQRQPPGRGHRGDQVRGQRRG